MATVTAQAAGRSTQTIEEFVGTALDEAKITPLHRKVIALIAAGYFFDVIDFTVLRLACSVHHQIRFRDAGASCGPDRQRHHFRAVHRHRRAGRILGPIWPRFIYQFNLLLFGVFTILGALSPSVTACWSSAASLPASGLGAEQPLCFAYAGEYAPKRIRGRILAIIHFIGGACVWPIGTALVLWLPLWRRTLTLTRITSGAASG